MPDITFTLTQANLTKLVDAYCWKYNYQTRVPAPNGYIDNPESKADFARRMQKQEWVDLVKSYDRYLAQIELQEPNPITIT